MAAPSVQISATVSAERAGHGGFTARRLAPDRLGGLAGPLMGLDHYRMSEVTFAPHPHAGFSAISYVFEDSTGGLRNRDSLGNDFVVEPGGLVWTQAGSGVIHDELPNRPGTEVHGLQIFVNLKAAHKHLEPRVLRLANSEVPTWTSKSGATARIIVGELHGITSPVEPAEPFSLFDIAIPPSSDLDLPLSGGVGMTIYAAAGRVEVRTAEQLTAMNEGDAVSISAGANVSISLASHSASRVIVLAGEITNEAVAQYGPFIMSNQDQIVAAVQRYQRGEMGVLPSLDA